MLQTLYLREKRLKRQDLLELVQCLPTFVPGPEKEFEKEEERTDLKILLMKALSTLSTRASLILYLYYTERWTLQNIGDDLTISGERVRKIKEEALGELRNNYPQLKKLLYL